MSSLPGAVRSPGIPLEVGIAIPDTVDEFLALTGEAPGYRLRLYGIRYGGWFRKRRGVLLHECPLQLPHLPRYVGERVVSEPISYYPQYTCSPRSFELLQGGSVVASGGRFDGGYFTMWRGDRMDLTVTLVGVP